MEYKILFIDDEKDILSALGRLFIDDEFDIYSTTSPNDALEILKKDSMDLIVSDQRMAEMSGVELLSQSRVYSPDSVRILLTGYADIKTAISSINDAGVYRYVSKPWDNSDLKSTIISALEFGRLKKENARLLELTKKQNFKLIEFNTHLKDKVKEQTNNIRAMLDESVLLNKKLNISFVNSIKVFINMIKLRNPFVAIHMKDTSRMAKSIAMKMKLSKSTIRDIEIAALLLDIGQIGTTDSILNKAYGELTTLEKTEYMKHPVLGQAALQSIESMKDIGMMVRAHHETWNGNGFPDRLKSVDIPLASRIIAVANDYDGLLKGVLLPSKFTQQQAKEYIVKNSKVRYDPEVVLIFVSILGSQIIDDEKKLETKVASQRLKSGMILARDLFTFSGILILNEGTKLTELHINSIRDFENTEKKKYEIFFMSE